MAFTFCGAKKCAPRLFYSLMLEALSPLTSKTSTLSLPVNPTKAVVIGATVNIGGMAPVFVRQRIDLRRNVHRNQSAITVPHHTWAVVLLLSIQIWWRETWQPVSRSALYHPIYKNPHGSADWLQ